MFKKYDLRIREILMSKSREANWQNILTNHKEMIAIIQHERLIHLLVTIFTGTVMSLSFFFTILTEKPTLFLLDIILLVLFLGYIIHYYYLENTTQSWYKIQEEIKDKLLAIHP